MSEDAQSKFQEVSLRGFSDGKVGIYSTFHDGAVFKYGYNDPRSIRLAYMYVALHPLAPSPD
jgi:hypothetical protein